MMDENIKDAMQVTVRFNKELADFLSQEQARTGATKPEFIRRLVAKERARRSRSDKCSLQESQDQAATKKTR